MPRKEEGRSWHRVVHDDHQQQHAISSGVVAPVSAPSTALAAAALHPFDSTIRSDGPYRNAWLRSMKCALLAPHVANPVAHELAKKHFISTAVVERFSGQSEKITAQREALCGEFQEMWDEQERFKTQRRMQALKDSNADEYLRHLSSIKMSALLAIMEQTHQFMLNIGAQLERRVTGAAAAANAATSGTLASNHSVMEDAGGASEEYRKFKQYVGSTRDEYKLVHRVETAIDNQPQGVLATLMPHQMVGLRFLASLHTNNINGILADEMGVGKTLQTLSFLQHLKESGRARGPHLVLAPLSIVREWTEAAATFIPTLRVVTFEALETATAAAQHDLVLLAIHRVRHFVHALSCTRWDFVIVDEAHKAVSNPDTQTAAAIKAVPYKSRLVLTGTPLNNDVQELWALLNFINPSVFDNRGSFEDVFRRPFAAVGSVAAAADIQLSDEEREVLVLRLHQILRPFMLRRTKQDIDASLRITFHNLLCPLSALQKRLLEQLRTRGTLPAILGGAQIGVRHVTGRESHALAICNHPFNIPFFTQVMVQQQHTDSNQDHSDQAGDTILLPADALVRTSGKFLVLVTLLQRLRSIGRKAVVFSHFLDTIDLLSETLDAIGMRDEYVVLTGATSVDERQAFVHRFRNEAQVMCFILSVKAGGCGLNLQVADVVILIDRDYTATNEDQAIARVFRMGQRNTVRAMYLSTCDPAERRVTDIAERKNRPRLAIIEGGAFHTDTAATEVEGDAAASVDALHAALSVAIDDIDLSTACAANSALHAKLDPLLCGESDERLVALQTNDTITFPAAVAEMDELPPPMSAALLASERVELTEAADEHHGGRGQRATGDVWYGEAPDWYVAKWADEGLDEAEIEEKYRDEQLKKQSKKAAATSAATCDIVFASVPTVAVLMRAGLPSMKRLATPADHTQMTVAF
jgi:ATP-dependent helicase STH1/SNF2